MQPLYARPAPKQIDTLAPEFPGAGTSQQKSKTTPLYQSMNLVQQRRQLLYFINDYDATIVAAFLDVPRILGKAYQSFRRKKVEYVRVGEKMVDKRRLAALTRTEQKDRLAFERLCKI